MATKSCTRASSAGRAVDSGWRAQKRRTFETLVDQVTFSITSQLPVQPTLDVINIGSNRNLVVSGSNQTTLLTYRLDALGTIGGISKPAGGPVGVISAQSVMSVGGNTL